MHAFAKACLAPAIAAILCGGLLSGARADDAAVTVLQRLADALATGGGTAKVTYDPPAGTTGGTSFARVRITSGNGPQADTFSAASLVLSGTSIDAAGTVTIAAATLAGLEATDSSGAKTTADQAVLSGIIIPAAALSAATATPEPAAEVPAAVPQIGSLDIKNITFSGTDGQPAARAENIAMLATDFTPAGPRHMVLTMSHLALDTANPAIAGATSGMLSRMGYAALDIGIRFETTWNDQTGVLHLDAFSIDARDIGALVLAGDIGGLTPDALAAMRTAPQDASARMLAALSVGPASLSFADKSITGKVLADVAKSQNTTAEELSATAGAMVPAFAAMLNNPPLQDKITVAALAFLARPGTLTVKISPDAPVPAATLMAADPAQLPAILKLDVVAKSP